MKSYNALYRGPDKSLARPGRKQAQKHVSDARDFNNIETRAVIKFFFLQGKAPKEFHAILTETLACFLLGWAKDLSAPLYCTFYQPFNWLLCLSVCSFKFNSCFKMTIHKTFSGLLKREPISETLVFHTTQIISCMFYQSWSLWAQNVLSRRIYVCFILSYSVINRHEHCTRYIIHMDHFTLHCMFRVDWSDREGAGALWGGSTAAQCPPWSQSKPEVKMASLPDLLNVVDTEEKSNTIYFDCLEFYGHFIYEETSA